MAKRKKITDPDKVELTELYPDVGGDDTEYDEGYVRRFLLQCYREAEAAKFDRMQQNKQNFDIYHMRHDFSHKIPGQSREVLSMQRMAVESTASFFQQALVDEGDWWGSDAKDPKSETKLKVRPDVVHSITQLQLDKAGILRHVGIGVKSGILGSLMITKVTGKYSHCPAYVANRKPGARKATLKKIDKKAWQLDLPLVNQKHYFPDPTGAGLYEIEEMWTDYRELVALSQGKDAIYDPEVVAEISGGSDDSEEKLDQRRRTNQNETDSNFRRQINIKEFWGDILDEDGEVLCENVVCTLANDKWLIRPPTPNPLWHKQSPYVTGALMDIPDAVWPPALADAGTKHNISLTELFNLMVDGGNRAVNNVGMIRVEWLEDPSEIENGIKPGTNLKVNGSAPPGAKVLEMVSCGTVPPDAQNMFNIQRQEFNAAMLTSDIRQGIQPKREVAATQIVETSQTITSVFQGITKQIEQNWIKRVLEKSWMTCCQFSDEMDEDEIRAVLGDRADAWLQLTPEERFAETVSGIKFDVYGITQQMAKAQDFRKLTTLLQTIGGNPVFMEAFTKKYSVDEALREAMVALGINVRRLEISEAEQELMNKPQQPPPGPQGPDDMSQVQSPNTGSMADQLGSAAGPMAQVQARDFPGSKATPKGGF